MGKVYQKTTGLAIQQGIFEESSTAKHSVGTRMQLADGRVFYYAKAGGTLAQGKLAMAPSIEDNHTNKAVTTAAAVGAYTFGWTPGATAITAAMYDEGYAVVNDASGEGYTYKIKTIPATSASTACTVTLYDPLQVALTTSSEITLFKNLFAGVTHTATEENIPAGIPLRAGTSAYYVWLQTWGMVGCLRATVGVTSDHGAMLIPSATAGAVTGVTGTTAANNYRVPLVGISGSVGVVGEYRPICLQLHP